MTVTSPQSIKGYQLLELIGEGAFGAVYRAHQEFVDRQVAIKAILPEYANQPDFIRRFDAEAHLVAQLEHIHIVPLYDYWRDPEGAYLVMRLMRGGSLSDSLKKTGPWDPATTAGLVDQIASALDAAHQQGVVHRDLKPANILLDEDGNAFLSDFGIAKELAAEADDTLTGPILGTPAYITPEQVQNQPITPQTDIYALGVLIYEILVGDHPFPDTSPAELVVKHLQESLPYVRSIHPELPAALDGVIQRATSKDPGARYPSASALAEDYRRALELEAFIPEEDIYNPYKGLRAFQEADEDDFYGREVLTGQLLAHLATPGAAGHFLAVVGPSGSGKSSVVKAGLLPALRKGALPGAEGWFIVETHPGTRPLQELQLALLSISADPSLDLGGLLTQGEDGLLHAVQATLPGPDSQLLLVIDQFEELFSLVEDEAQRDHYLGILVQVVNIVNSQVRVVLTLRADFYDQPLKHPTFGGLVEKSTQVVLPLSDDELRQVIERPAERVGTMLEKGLVQEIIQDVADQPGALPLLQYALTELFERRQGRMLTHQAYQDIGGVLGALGRRAEEVYNNLAPDAREVARQLFLRLVTLGEGAVDTRRQVLRSELQSLVGEGADLVSRVIDAFGKARLLSFDRDPETREPTVEVAHEALLQEWRRLREWLDQSRADIRMQRVLGNVATDWLGANQDPSFLLRGSRLDQFEAWDATCNLALTQVEQEYLQASLEERRFRQAAEAKRLAREAAAERRSRNFLRGLVAVLGIAAVVAVMLSIYAFNQQGIAQTEANQRATAEVIAVDERAEALAQADARATQQAIAEEQRAIAEEQQTIRAREAEVNHSLFLAAQSQIAMEANNIDLALALAWEANQIPDPPGQAQMALSVAAYAPGGTIRRFGSHEAQVWVVDLSPDGKFLLSGTENGEIYLWDVTTGEIPHRLEGHTGPVSGIAFSPDGRFALTSGQGGVSYWDLEKGEAVYHFTDPEIQFNQPDINPDGSVAALSSGRFLDVFPFQEDNNVRLWELETGEVIHEIPFSDGVTMVDFSPDGSMLVASTVADGIVVLDVATGEVLFRFLEEMMNMTVAAFIQEGLSLLVAGSGSQNHLVQIDLETDETTMYESSHNDVPLDIAINPDGKRALTTSDDDTMEWDLESRTQIQALGLPGTSMTYNPDGRAAYVGSRDSFVHLISLESGAFVDGARIPIQSGGVRSTAYSPDGDYVLYSVPRGDMVYLFDLESGQLSQQFSHTPGSPFAVAFSPDGQYVLSTYYDDGSLSYWDVHTGEEILRMGAEGTVHSRLADAVAFHPSGKFALSGAQSENNQVAYWDLTTGEPVWTSNREEIVVAAVYGLDISPDGKTGLTRDNYLTLWNLDNGEELLRLSPEGAEWGWEVAFLDDQTAIVSEDSRMILWDLNTGTAIRDYLGHSGQIKGLALCPDGRLGVSASSDSTLILWDIATGEPLRRYYGNHDHVNSVSFSPKCHEFFSGSRAGEAFRWRVDTDLEALQAWVTANRILTELSCAERQFYNIQPPCDE